MTIGFEQRYDQEVFRILAIAACAYHLEVNGVLMPVGKSFEVVRHFLIFAAKLCGDLPGGRAHFVSTPFRTSGTDAVRRGRSELPRLVPRHAREKAGHRANVG